MASGPVNYGVNRYLWTSQSQACASQADPHGTGLFGTRTEVSQTDIHSKCLSWAPAPSIGSRPTSLWIGSALKRAASLQSAYPQASVNTRWPIRSPACAGSCPPDDPPQGSRLIVRSVPVAHRTPEQQYTATAVGMPRATLYRHA